MWHLWVAPRGGPWGWGWSRWLARGRSLEAGSRWVISEGGGLSAALPLAASAEGHFWVHSSSAHLGALVCLKCYDKRFILWGLILPSVKWKGTGNLKSRPFSGEGWVPDLPDPGRWEQPP